MTDPQFTPGRWERRRSSIVTASDPQGFSTIIARVVFPISTKEKAADRAESERAFANARLIYSAPELYALHREYLADSVCSCEDWMTTGLREKCFHCRVVAAVDRVDNEPPFPAVNC